MAGATGELLTWDVKNLTENVLSNTIYLWIFPCFYQEVGLDDLQKRLPIYVFCDFAPQHPQTTPLVLQPVAAWMGQSFDSINISPSPSTISISLTFTAHVLLLLACYCLLQPCNCNQLLLPAKIEFSHTDRTINDVISSFDRFHIDLKPLPAQCIFLLFHLIEETHFWADTYTTMWTSMLKNKKPWK